jgi:hypothetical protein
MLKQMEYHWDNALKTQDDNCIAERFFNCNSENDIKACQEIISFIKFDVEECFENAKDLFTSGAWKTMYVDCGTDKSDLLNGLQYAWGCYNEEQFWNNANELFYNYAVNYINNNFAEEIEKFLEEKDFEELLLHRIRNVDGGHTLKDVEEIVKAYIEDVRYIQNELK